ncbi:NAD(P)H-hydrate dehydratase [Roseimaritima ulvae]|nr:NAD(P)H-hydrate dehydratase [Roseimaritima ulvae]
MLPQSTPLPSPPDRDDNAHKGTFGHLLLIAGSVSMSGAARLSGTAALRGGVGLLTIATPRSALPIVAAENPAWMTLPLDESEGNCVATAVDQIEAAWQRKAAVALGPGLGQTDGVVEVVRQTYADCPLPMVLDADGLNAFAKHTDALKTRADDAPRVLTPHPGELARLLGTGVGDVQNDRQRVATVFAAAHKIVLVLKGPGTIITDGQRTVVNTTGNSGMARGGSGDILTGLIAALLAQGMSAFDAAHLATHLHGLAGDIAAEKFTKQAMLVTDLLDCLPEAWRTIDKP